VVPSQTKDQAAEVMADWGEIVECALEGDRVAYAKLTRLVTGHLARWHAFDFRADWEDIVQEVLVSTVAAYNEGRLASTGAFRAYVRQATRFKFIDRIRAAQKWASDRDPEETRDRGEAGAAPMWPPRDSVQGAALEMRGSVRQAIERLTERERLAVLEVYLRGRTYDEAADATGIALGTLKRALRTGLARLKEVLDEG
jgi:RNA polymerase sigma factor (sigma-70 family)